MSAGASNTTYQNSQGSNTAQAPSIYDATAFSSTGRDQSGTASLGSFGFRKNAPVNNMTEEQQADSNYKATSSTFMDAGAVNKEFIAPSNGNNMVTPRGGSGNTVNSTGSDMFATGKYNIANGNQMGYEGNSAVKAGASLQALANTYPAWAPGGVGVQIGAALFADPLIGYQEVDTLSGPVTGTRGSFAKGTFTDSTPTDISGGAMGSNVGTNANGDAVSLGYGYGQMDPSIARSAGYSADPSYNPTPVPVETISTVDGSRSVQTTNPATGVSTTEYYSDSGVSQGSYTAGQGLTLTDRNDDGSYNVPTLASGSSSPSSSSSSSSSGGK